MFYNGQQSLTSNSAGVCVDQQVRKPMIRAGLNNTRGLTAGSLRLWAAIKDATDAPSLHAGARRAGIRFTTLHRHIHQLGDHAFLTQPNRRRCAGCAPAPDPDHPSS